MNDTSRHLSSIYSSDEEENDQEVTEDAKGETQKRKEAPTVDEQLYKKTKRNPKPKLSAAALIGADGIARVSQNARLRKLVCSNNIHSAARACNTIMDTYKNFCFDLMPSVAFEDAIHSIEQLGAKKEVKEYLQHIRDGHKDIFVEKQLGREKADKLTQELERGLRQQKAYDAQFDTQATATTSAGPHQ